MKNVTVNANNQLVVDLNALMPSSKRQQFTVNSLIKNGEIFKVINYLQSFKSDHKIRTDIQHLKQSGHDHLGQKRKRTIERMFHDLKSVGESHRPLVAGNRSWIGVEIECFIPFKAPNDLVFESDIEDCNHCDGTGDITDDEGNEYGCDECSGTGEYQNEEVPIRSLGRYLHSREVKRVSLKQDGSLQAPEEGGYFPVEITILTQLNNPVELKQLCTILNELGAVVNRSCGLHVHLDARHLNAGEVVTIGDKFQKCLPVMGSMVPRTRRKGNRYCRLEVSALDGDRYAAVNLTAYNKYKTIEIRLHSSTTDFDKIINWSRLMHAIMTSKSKFTRICHDLNMLTEFVRIDENLVEYFGQRIALFGDVVEPVAESARDRDEVLNADDLAAMAA